MKKKEHYWHILPHFQQPGQAYFVTWCLKDSVPAKAISRYKAELQEKQNQIDYAKNRNEDQSIIKTLHEEYSQIRNKYIKAYNDLLDQGGHLLN